MGWSIRSSEYRGTCIVTVVWRQGRILIIVVFYIYADLAALLPGFVRVHFTTTLALVYRPIRVRYRSEEYVNKCVCAAEVARLRYLGVRRWTGVARHDMPDTVTLPNEATWNKDFCVSLVCYKLFSY